MKMAERSSGKTPGGTTVARVTVGELRTSFKAVEKKLAQGVRVQVTRRGEVVAEVIPLGVPSPPVVSDLEDGNDFALHVPGMMARMREIWGDTPLTIDTTALISESRDRDFLL